MTRREPSSPVSCSRVAIARGSGSWRPSGRPACSPTWCTQDTYLAASRIHDLLVKTHPADRDKIAEIRALVARHFDVEGLLRAIDERAPRNTETRMIVVGTPERAVSRAPAGPLRGMLARLRGR